MALTPLHQLKDELDQLLEDYLEALDHYQQARERLSSLLKSAHFDLARAKLALGPGRVGPAKYDLTERASNKVVRIAPWTAEEVPAAANGFTNPTWTYALTDRPAGDEDELPALAEDGQGTLRRRVHATDAAAKEDSQEAPALSSPPTTATTTLLRPSPLAQFSALPPPVLRASATSFTKAAEVAVELVDAEARVRDCARRIKRARKEVDRRAKDDGEEVKEAGE
ncbi:hypothetical protein JCM10908_004680 [Rhodotorula pacifica]|uniref:uncharacterized protein n=1 Tax=Rhodotorula pacifica TaxID=1495444 RepID=UPI00317709E2